MVFPLIGALVLAVFIGVNSHKQDLKVQSAQRASYEVSLAKVKVENSKLKRARITRSVKLDGIEVVNLEASNDE